ncbi:uncharacterized protein MELLADRAFT_85034 [Melampsora larici-populina 98AG31]|uniref:Uncharacterized protein n=1 Tax=Melampsora larici-populina (strain 98AG31 / pathotype 3-4-7) TaxID=747676 RepID=F4RH33_MELLP|nr:uncharacterized protein MELLADRAFT_85034 [Melampsora larici-populina 98AG31]EGG08232.1 hypothetical protein MELLADRAFT_85034 [Melampsora larici-populina 98AG31]
MALVIKYVNQAREHPTWDSPEDQQKRLQKMGNYDSTSDQLMKLKFKRVIEKLWELGKSSPKDHPPAKSSTNPAKGVKRRMVSNPTSDPNVAVAQEPKPPPKRQHNVASTSTAILILSDNEILAEDNEVVFIKSNINTASQKKNKKKKRRRNKIERHPRGQALKCHCGSAPVTLHGGRFERAEAHWLTDKCAKTTAQLRSNKLLSSFFVKDPALQPVNRNIIEAACPGLTDKTWPRPKSERTIAEFMDSTCTIYRGNVQHKILKELFGDDLGENDLTESQKAKLVTELDARSTWEVKRHGERNAIYSTSCKRTVNHHKKDPLQPCDSCLELKDLSSLRRALNHKYAKGDNKKFTPNYLLVIDKYNTIVNECKEVKILGKSLESSRNGDFGDFLDHLVIMARRGIFENRQAVKGMIMGCAIRAEREEAGKSLRGMRIDTHLNDCLTTLGAMSKSALKLLTENFVGKTLRCQRMDRARSKTEIEDGMVQGNFDRAAAILTELGYSGPVAVGSDQTVCVQTLRHHRGFIVGAQGGDIPFDNPDELQKMLEKIKKQNNLCSKIRAYTIQVPLPNIPTLVVALLASASDEGADEISVLHDNMIRMSQASGINVLSIGADGAANEIAAQVKLNQMTIPLFGNPPRPVVTLQDPKHARKTVSEKNKCFKIFSNLAESFLALIISHRDYYPDFPFCPWKHGTEACEHIFGWMRVISPNFSVLDARLMMPKIMAVVKSIMSGRMKIAPSEHVHAGYQYDLRESDINNLDHLRNFPSNSEITSDLTTAKKRAVSMAEFCGMVSSELEDLDHDIEDIVSSTVDKVQEDYLDISTSASKDYEVRYGYEFGEFPENEAFEAAARLTKEQNALAVMLDQVPETLEDEVVQNAAMSISNLLNSSDEPEQPNAPASPKNLT